VSDKQLSESMCLQDVAMNLLAIGYSMAEVAEVLGFTVSSIYNWKYRNPSFSPTVKRLSEEVKQKKRRSPLVIR
jgi:transposase